MIVLSMPAVYTLEITPACNNGCPGCFNASSIQPARWASGSDAGTWEGLLAEIGPHAARIRLTGGEPTLHPEFPRILSAASAWDAPVTVFTNGRWPRPNRTLSALKESRSLAGLLVSLHGATATAHEAFTRVPGSHAQALRSAKMALDAGITVAFSTVLTRAGLGEMEALLDLAEGLGAEYVAFNRPLGPAARSLSRAELLGAVRRIEAMIERGRRATYGACIPQCLRTSHSDGCHAGVTHLTIGSDGAARACIYAKSTVGNVFAAPLKEVWHGPRMQAWRAQQQDESCIGCAAYPVCHGGCPAAREWLEASDPLQGAPRRRYTVTRTVRALPEAARPSHALRIREEEFGYSLIGRGQIWPVLPEGREILEACDGRRTVGALREAFRAEQIDLLQELWNAGMVDLQE